MDQGVSIMRLATQSFSALRSNEDYTRCQSLSKNAGKLHSTDRFGIAHLQGHRERVPQDSVCLNVLLDVSHCIIFNVPVDCALCVVNVRDGIQRTLQFRLLAIRVNPLVFVPVVRQRLVLLRNEVQREPHALRDGKAPCG